MMIFVLVLVLVIENEAYGEDENDLVVALPRQVLT
jgi:hypothetical protein